MSETESHANQSEGLNSLLGLSALQQSIDKLSGQFDRFAEKSADLRLLGTKITASNLTSYLPPEMLEHMGFSTQTPEGARGANVLNHKEFGEGVAGIEKWVVAIFGGLWGYEQIIDPSLRTLVKNDIFRRWDLPRAERVRLLELADGCYFIHNYNLAWLGSGGDISSFTATEEKGGVVSPCEDDRLDFKHLCGQVTVLKPLGKAISLLDKYVATSRYDPNVAVPEKPVDFCSRLTVAQVSGIGRPEWELDYIKGMAIAWYRVTGLQVAREYAEKHMWYTKKLVSPQTNRPMTEAEWEKNEWAKKLYREAIGYKRWSKGDPFNGLYDPLWLMADVWKRNQRLVANIRLGIREVSGNQHNILSLGWTSAGYRFIEAISGDPIEPNDLNNKELPDLNALTPEQWARIKEVDLQDLQIKKADKAKLARDALIKAFTLKPEGIVEYFASIITLVRSNDSTKEGIFIRGAVLPIAMRAVQEIVQHYYDRGIRIPIGRFEMQRLLAGVEEEVYPVKPWGAEQAKYVVDRCIDTQADAVYQAMRGR